MVKIVKLDKHNNYLIDVESNTIVDKYDSTNPNIQLVMKLDDDSILKVDADKIKTEYGNQIVVNYNDDKYIIDDGYQNILIKAGYIVYKDYDVTNITDKDEGIKLRDELLSKLDNVIGNLYDDVIIDNSGNSEFSFNITSDNHEYTIIIETVNSIVSKNQQRKYNSLSFYPFLKSMDKYRTLYISIFARKMNKVTNESDNEKFRRADSIIKDIVNEAGPDFHYNNQIIKRRVIYQKGL
jgi:hypothetical protein